MIQYYRYTWFIPNVLWVMGSQMRLFPVSRADVPSTGPLLETAQM